MVYNKLETKILFKKILYKKYVIIKIRNLINLYEKKASILIIAGAISANAQVGINTTEPKSSLDIVSKPNMPEAMDGILIPRVSGSDLKTKTYTASQNSALVYVTEGLDTDELTGQVEKVDKSGFYFFNSSINKLHLIVTSISKMER